jgi:hypothetical protein
MAELFRKEIDSSGVTHMKRVNLGKKRIDPIEEKVKEIEETKLLVDITEESHEELMKADTLFPFKIFSDTITIDRQKVTIVKRSFFLSAEVLIVKIGDIINVEASIGPLLGTLKIYSRYLTDAHHEISALRRTDAQKMQRLLQGLLIAHEKGIDSASVPKEELIVLLSELGHPVQ